MMDNANADAFLAVVTAVPVDGATAAEDVNPRLWTVNPLIQEYDGSECKPIKVISVGGIKVSVGQKVLVLTIRNNIETLEIISRYWEATAASGVIIDVVDTVQYVMRGGYTIEGTLTVQKKTILQDNLDVIGSTKLGSGETKMVRGAELQEFCEEVVSVLNSIIQWGATGVPPGPTGGIAPLTGVLPPEIPATLLSEKNTLE